MDLQQLNLKAVIMIGLLLPLGLKTGLSSSASADSYHEYQREAYNNSSTFLIQIEKADLTGDSKPETITLSGTKQNPASSYYDKLNIRVVNGLSDSPIINISSPGGYSPSLQLVDVNGDQISELWLSTSPQDKETAAASISLYSIQNDRAVSLPLPPPLHMKGLLKDNYKASATILDTNQTYMLDLLKSRASYDAAKYYQNSRLLKPAKLIVNSYHKLEPIDRDKDGTWEIRGVQHLAILSNENTVAIAESLWKWRYNQWTLVNAKIISTS